MNRIERKEHKAMNKKIYHLTAILNNGRGFRLSTGKKISKLYLIFLLKKKWAIAEINYTSNFIFVVKANGKYHLRSHSNSTTDDNILSLPIEKGSPNKNKKIHHFFHFHIPHKHKDAQKVSKHHVLFWHKHKDPQTIHKTHKINIQVKNFLLFNSKYWILFVGYLIIGLIVGGGITLALCLSNVI